MTVSRGVFFSLFFLQMCIDKDDACSKRYLAFLGESSTCSSKDGFQCLVADGARSFLE